MRLAFSGEGRYPDFKSGYALYRRRARRIGTVDEAVYRRVIRAYCRALADKLEREGAVELPCGMGTLMAAELTRKPQYRGRLFIGYGAPGRHGALDGTLKAFGIVFLPRRDSTPQLRSCGFVANRGLFRRMKARYTGGWCDWAPADFDDSMI